MLSVGLCQALRYVDRAVQFSRLALGSNSSKSSFQSDHYFPTSALKRVRTAAQGAAVGQDSQDQVDAAMEALEVLGGWYRTHFMWL